VKAGIFGARIGSVRVRQSVTVLNLQAEKQLAVPVE
jgi:hypothetical protein